MTASVNLFCTESEELTVLQYLTKDTGVVIYDVFGDQVRERDVSVLRNLPDWQSALTLYFLRTEIGNWVLHTDRPQIELDTEHAVLVNDLLARDRWDQSSITPGEGMVDFERSPVLVYQRGKRIDGKIRASQVMACPSRLSHVSDAYEKWVKRVMGWVRQKSEIVHDYRTPSHLLPNPEHLLTTTYALPQAKALIESGDHPFEIGI